MSTRKQVPTGGGQRGSYHHGDLTNALTEAAVQLARAGGPEAVVLREAARQVGVSATAAYRHFVGHSDLLQTVKQRALAALAGSMERELAAGPVEPDPGEDALRRLRALSTGYVRFARSEPGLFRAAFSHLPKPVRPHPEATGHPVIAEPTDPAFQMLCAVLDDLVATGLMPAQRRQHAPLAAWSMVHGLAVLLLDGPYAHLADEQADAVMRSTVEVAIYGLCGRCPENRR